ncbi:hypothetical protein [Patulibacter americanus]|uniref:hypothetical protein n=1 Tax=Patulibacter americanus TaxID=588672 RepID=UPI0003B30538|nr:hypothetical protein [Patulibacter americanus]
MTSPLLRPAPWLAARDLPVAATALLGAAALAVAVGGYEHAHLYHRGYSEIDVIGPLFLVNAVASLACVLILLARRPAAFVLSSLAISVGSLVAIVLTRTTGLFGFLESGYDSRAILTVVAEVLAVVLTLAGAWVARDRLFSPPPSRPATDDRAGVAA